MLNQLLLVPLLFGQPTPNQNLIDSYNNAPPFNPSYDDFGSLSEDFNGPPINGKSVTATKGTQIKDLLTLGDIKQSGVGEYTFGQILGESGTSLEGLTLEDFPLLANTTLEQAADATNNDPDFLNNVLLDNNTVQEAIKAGDGDKTLAQKLGVEKPLKDIAKVQDAVIEKLNKWESEAIGAIPGLSAIPLARYPAQLANTSLAAISLFAKADIILDKAEKGIDNTVTGSEKEKTKFNTPCIFTRQQVCGHIELLDFVSVGLKGTRWINGKHQKVRGGHGVLGEVFDNKEPTGRLPFGPGSPFKLVLTETTEVDSSSKERGTFSAYFRFCEFLAGCTPYVIGPFPLYSVSTEGVIWMGVNPTQFGEIPIGFDPAVSSPPGQGTGPGLYSPVGSGPKGTGKKGECAQKSGKSIQYEWPAQGVITSFFGPRVPPCPRCSGWHGGLDVGAPYGTPIIAGEGGTIEFAGNAGGLGNAVYLRVECTGHLLIYGHNQRNNVKAGDKVRRGQQIAEMGSTGYSTGPHSHFTVKIGNDPVDPLYFLPSR